MQLWINRHGGWSYRKPPNGIFVGVERKGTNRFRTIWRIGNMTGEPWLFGIEPGNLHGALNATSMQVPGKINLAC